MQLSVFLWMQSTHEISLRLQLLPFQPGNCKLESWSIEISRLVDFEACFRVQQQEISPALHTHRYPGFRFWHLMVFCLLHEPYPSAHSSMSSSQLSPLIPSTQKHWKLPGVFTHRLVKMGLQRFRSKWLFSTHSFTSTLHRLPFHPDIVRKKFSRLLIKSCYSCTPLYWTRQ